MIRAALALLLMVAGPAAAIELRLPSGARMTAERVTDPDVYAAPVGAYAAGVVPMVTLEGTVERGAWQIATPSITPLQVMRPLREQLEVAGFRIVLDCAAEACGGFDFRFGIETLPGPGMYVNIRNYHFVTALRGADDAPAEAITVLTTTTTSSAYVQVIRAGDLSGGPVETTAQPLPVSEPEVPPGSFGAQLLAQGHLVLTGLEFETGSADLGSGPFASLQSLAEFLAAQGDLRVALVGHTDSIGGLEGNIALSKRRAQSVRQRMIETYGVDPARLDAEGMGYLSPVASNLEEAGRQQNRRVEAILLHE